MRTAPWEDNAEFCAVAAIAWKEDFKTATEEASARGHSLKKTARIRMARRFEGSDYTAILLARITELEAKVAELEEAAKA